MRRLSPIQEQIVQACPRHRAVYAGPGSGKTATLIHHIAAQLESGQVPAEGFLILTYTKQAAIELKERLDKLERLRKREVATLRIGTFHAMMFRMLLQAGHAVHPMITPIQRTNLLHSILTKQGLSGNVQSVDQALSRHFSTWESPDVGRSVKRIVNAYQTAKRRLGLWDFDDVLHTFCDAVSRTNFAWHRIPTVQYVLVDEFQDTNGIQIHILQQIVARYSAPLFVVGDEDQAIYGFRGADPKWLLNFPAMFAGVEMHALTENFRSDQSIVQHAQSLIQHNQYRSEKAATIMSEAPGTVACYAWKDEQREAIAVSNHLILQAGQTGSTAILARTRRQLRGVAAKLPIEVRRLTAFHTLHDAKGKEWDEVHILGAVEQNPYLRDGSAVDGEEERRLFYVGMTRSRHRLFIHAPHRVSGHRARPTPFVAESDLALNHVGTNHKFS